MKKILSLILCALLAFSCCASLAEGAMEIGSVNVNGNYILTAKLPDGYKLTMKVEQDGYLQGELTTEDVLKPRMVFSIAADETYAEAERMNDLTEADLAVLESSFEAGSKISYGETSEGTKLMIVRSTLESHEYIAILTYYKGYMIEFDLFAGPDGKLSEDQEKVAIAFLSDMQFMPVEAKQ